MSELFGCLLWTESFMYFPYFYLLWLVQYCTPVDYVIANVGYITCKNIRQMSWCKTDINGSVQDCSNSIA